MTSTPRSALFVTLMLSSACSSGPAWTDEERRQLAALQKAVDVGLAANQAAMTTNSSVTLPPGCTIGDVDQDFHVLPKLGKGDLLVRRGRHGKFRLPAATVHMDGGTTVAIAGESLAFDSVADIAVQEQLGAVMLATRRGQQTVVTRNSTWSGKIWREDLRPMLSTDGTHFAYVEEGVMTDRSMLGKTTSPEQAVPLAFGCTVHWPVWPGRDGSRVRAIVEDKGHIEVRDGGNVIAIAEKYAHPFFDAERDQLQVHLITGGKTRFLIGDRLAPPLDSYRWLRQSSDSQHYAAVGREGTVDQLVVNGNVVLRHDEIVDLALAADGSAWACAVKEGGSFFVVRANGRTGPMAEIAELVFAPDGSALAVCTKDDTKKGRPLSWSIEGVTLAGYESVSNLHVLPKGAGVAFCGKDQAGWWIVLPTQKDGPWERIAWFSVLDDGKHVRCLAQRGQEAHRRVLSL